MHARRCRLKPAVWLVLMAVAVAPAPGQDSSPYFLPLPAPFPRDVYTPHGYLDNPWHSMVANRSGVVRSYPPLAFGWWRTDFHKRGYVSGNRDHVNYVAILRMAVTIEQSVFIESKDFRTQNVELSSAYHTKSLMSYDWTAHDVAVSLRYALPSEHTLACFVDIQNTSSAKRVVTLYPGLLYGIGTTNWWGSDGLMVRYDSTDHMTISKIWAYGDVLALGSSAVPVGYYAGESEDRCSFWIRSGNPASTGSASIQGRGPIYAAQRHTLDLKPGERRTVLVCLSRGKNEELARKELRAALDGAAESARAQLREDGRFWESCPTLQGEWPDYWKRGWVYDYETLRMTVRPPLGIFRHPWDGMQIHAPRLVLGETSMDMLAMSYADPVLARRVLYGTFADAIAPNVPCVREDGSVNMISADGSECGTAPMWGYPFQVLSSLFSMSGDTAWLGTIYPHLKAYAHWWLKHRTDAEGWLHCNNSWESGQDGSRRFLVAEQNEGAVADFVRTVDVEASMAQALQVLERFAEILNKSDDIAQWDALAEQRIAHTGAMFFGGRYRDVDARTGKPIILKDSYDVMMLAPVACGVASPSHIMAVRTALRQFAVDPPPALQWPPSLFTYTEAAWKAGERQSAANSVAAVADRVYRRTDARDIMPGSDRFSYRIPGVANEYWPVQDIPAGGEHYGWGATLPFFIIRNIFGFRETDDPTLHAFLVAPCLPTRFLMGKGQYTISKLRYRGVTLSLTLSAAGPVEVQSTIRFAADNPVSLRVLDPRNGRKLLDSPLGRQGEIILTGTNGTAYRIQLVQ